MGDYDDYLIAKAADTLMRRFGTDTVHQTVTRAEELAFLGDSEGAELWWRIELELQARLGAMQNGSDSGSLSNLLVRVEEKRI